MTNHPLGLTALIYFPAGDRTSPFQSALNAVSIASAASAKAAEAAFASSKLALSLSLGMKSPNTTLQRFAAISPTAQASRLQARLSNGTSPIDSGPCPLLHNFYAQLDEAAEAVKVCPPSSQSVDLIV